jgi:hypothetical protein
LAYDGLPKTIPLGKITPICPTLDEAILLA